VNEALAGMDAWQARCKALGLAVTAPRRAVLRALLERGGTDAVELLQRARAHHAGISFGTVYRFMRELERVGLVRAEAQPHGRLRWHADASPASPADELRPLLAQLREFIVRLESLLGARHTGPV
jgi:Fe2+ or Zn2+ uptake regulation protein